MHSMQDMHHRPELYVHHFFAQLLSFSIKLKTVLANQSMPMLAQQVIGAK